MRLALDRIVYHTDQVAHMTAWRCMHSMQVRRRLTWWNRSSTARSNRGGDWAPRAGGIGRPRLSAAVPVKARRCATGRRKLLRPTLSVCDLHTVAYISSVLATAHSLVKSLFARNCTLCKLRREQPTND